MVFYLSQAIQTDGRDGKHWSAGMQNWELGLTTLMALMALTNIAAITAPQLTKTFCLKLHALFGVLCWVSKATVRQPGSMPCQCSGKERCRSGSGASREPPHCTLCLRRRLRMASLLLLPTMGSGHYSQPPAQSSPRRPHAPKPACRPRESGSLVLGNATPQNVMACRNL